MICAARFVFMSFDLEFLSLNSDITGGNILGPDYIVTNGSKTEKLVCNVTSVFPGANFTWDIPCNEQVTSSNDSICSVTPKISDDNKKITCTATNTRFSNLTTSASYIIRLRCKYEKKFVKTESR